MGLMGVSNKDSACELLKNKIKQSFTEPSNMPSRLKRYYGAGDFHFITFSCYQREPFLKTPEARNLFLEMFEEDRRNLGLSIHGYVVMPEHVHLLMPEPDAETISSFLKVAKQRFARRAHKERIIPKDQPVWQNRFYDFNVFTEKKRIEKLKYIHRNPVQRGLLEKPEEWQWSSFRFYLYNEPGILQVTQQLSPEKLVLKR
jgi:putative transposase